MILKNLTWISVKYFVFCKRIKFLIITSYILINVLIVWNKLIFHLYSSIFSFKIWIYKLIMLYLVFTIFSLSLHTWLLYLTLKYIHIGTYLLRYLENNIDNYNRCNEIFLYFFCSFKFFKVILFLIYILVTDIIFILN